MDAPSVATVRPAWKDIGYGSIAGMISKVFEHPFDLVKVRLQSQPLDKPVRFVGPIDCFRQTFANEGVRGLYRGLSMPIVAAMVENATLFVVYSQTQAVLRRYFPVSSATQAEHFNSAPLPLAHLAFAGGCAGAVTSFVLTPLELIKVRLQVQMIAQEAGSNAASSLKRVAPLPGPIQLTQTVLRERGVRGLWLGQTGTFIREAGGSVAWFSAFEAVCRTFIKRRQKSAGTASSRRITKDDLSSIELMLAGAAAGTSYTVVLFPADCIKSAIQTSDEFAGSKRSTGFLQVGRDIYNARGIRGLYSGCGVTIVRSAPSSAIIFWIYSLLERKFG